MNPSSSNWSIGILLLRFFIGARLIYGVIDNIISWQQMEEFAAFLSANGFPFPLASAISSVAVQFIGGVFVLLGFKIKWACVLLAFNFIVAIVFFHLRVSDSVEGMTPALAMLFGSLTLFFTGAGQYAVDND